MTNTIWATYYIGTISHYSKICWNSRYDKHEIWQLFSFLLIVQKFWQWGEKEVPAMHEAEPQDKTEHLRIDRRSEHLRIGGRLDKKLKRGYLVLTFWRHYGFLGPYKSLVFLVACQHPLISIEILKRLSWLKIILWLKILLYNKPVWIEWKHKCLDI